MKSSFALYQALIAINVPEDKATAVIDALESDMQTQLVTKADLAQHELATKSALMQLELKLTIRMGVMISAAVGILLAAMKFMH